MTGSFDGDKSHWHQWELFSKVLSYTGRAISIPIMTCLGWGGRVKIVSFLDSSVPVISSGKTKYVPRHCIIDTRLAIAQDKMHVPTEAGKKSCSHYYQCPRESG